MYIVCILSIDKGGDTMQRTINVNGDKIKVNVKKITRNKNIMGYSVKVNEKKYRIFDCLTKRDALEKGYVKYIKECR